MEITNPNTAIIKVNPESDIAVLKLVVEGNLLREYALARTIKTDEDLTPATNDLNLIASTKKALLELKEEYYRPAKTHLDAITQAFKTILTPLEDADRILGSKILAYRQAQIRRQREADEINRQALEVAKKQAEFNKTGEITVDLTPVEAPPVVNRVITETGSVGIMRIRKYRIMDFALLPDAYKLPNEGLLNAATKSGTVAIQGVEFYVDEVLAKRPTYQEREACKVQNDLK